MKYIIMCGGNYTYWEQPKHLSKIGNETLVERTIRLLRQNGITDIAISSNNPVFKQFDVEFIEMKNTHTLDGKEGYTAGRWMSGFYETNDPVCYIYGDVLFSRRAIYTIVNTETEDVEFFASAPPFDKDYRLPYAEPFAFKVVNQKHFQESIKEALAATDWEREPVSWELWQVIKGTPHNKIDYTNYTVINDYTRDIDTPGQLIKEHDLLVKCIENDVPGVKYMIHTYPKRKWYVEGYLIPSMLEQGIKRENIMIYSDDAGEGNLKACMNAFASVPDNNESTWHIQDDVCICKDFKKRTEMYSRGLVAGFSSALYDGPGRIGPVSVKDMWFSFPCILIPNRYARQCSEWITNYIIGNPIYQRYWMSGKNDDWAFRLYLKEFHKHDPALNLAPNLVDHVDYLLGGGSGGKRKEPCRSQYWIDEDIVNKLEEQINGKK